MGRKKQNLPVNERDDIDIQLAIYDQNLIIESYNSSRPKRVRQRDPLHPAHPLLPLRNMPYDSSSPTEGFEDSSEDEMREKREKLKKSKLVFSNCYMCQIDPAAQHLHTLGNGVDIEKMKKRRMTPQVVDKFHEKLGLKVNVDVLNVSESSLKSENIREIQKGGTLYTLKCLKTVRRSEYGVHCLSQHTETIDIMNDIVLRCPNWSSGCDFTSTRVKVKVGNLKFHPHTSTITHQPTADQFPESPDSVSYHNIETLPLWVYETLADYLPSSALFNLSLVNRTLRKVVFIAMNSKCYVEPVWEMERQGKWALKQYIWKVTSTEPPPETEWRVPVELNNHISQCQYFNPVSYEEKMVPVFSREFEKEIWDGFTNELSERLIRAEIRAVEDNVEEEEFEWEG